MPGTQGTEIQIATHMLCLVTHTMLSITMRYNRHSLWRQQLQDSFALQPASPKVRTELCFGGFFELRRAGTEVLPVSALARDTCTEQGEKNSLFRERVKSNITDGLTAYKMFTPLLYHYSYLCISLSAVISPPLAFLLCLWYSPSPFSSFSDTLLLQGVTDISAHLPALTYFCHFQACVTSRPRKHPPVTFLYAYRSGKGKGSSVSAHHLTQLFKPGPAQRTRWEPALPTIRQPVGSFGKEVLECMH